ILQWEYPRVLPSFTFAKPFLKKARHYFWKGCVGNAHFGLIGSTTMYTNMPRFHCQAQKSYIQAGEILNIQVFISDKLKNYKLSRPKMDSSLDSLTRDGADALGECIYTTNYLQEHYESGFIPLEYKVWADDSIFLDEKQQVKYTIIDYPSSENQVASEKQDIEHIIVW
ncbi:MAG: hypothetical protein AAF740_02375, partial [Bacteroidota bacterium]